MTMPGKELDVDPRRAKLAAAALAFFGTDTSGFPGAGVDSCAAAVNTILKQVFGHEFVRPGGDANNVTDLRIGLTENGWRPFDDPTLALPGDIDVQNGQQAGTSTNEFENHVGIVVSHGDGNLRVLSNSSSQKSFRYEDLLEFPNIGYTDPAKMGPSRFYRFKP